METKVKTSKKAPTNSELKAKIKNLEVQLQQCLEESPKQKSKPIQDVDGLEQRVEKAIESAFLTIKKLNPKENKFDNRYQAWWYFRDMLFESSLFSATEYWTDLDFRESLVMLNDICQATDAQPREGAGAEFEHFGKFELGRRLFGGSHEHAERKQRALKSLLGNLNTCRSNFDETDRSVSLEELDDMYAALLIVEACQKIWMNAQ